jgi:3-oxoacyl-(acyl-carrier-protein) synthase
MAYYINSAASSDGLTRDIKELVPAPDVRRRMSRVLRMGVSTGMEALARLPEGTQISAIITATRLGCLADSEKFLRNIIEAGDALLNPTPFIQSTFNTVGAQIALLTGNRCYNMTYVHGEESFRSALVDAMIQIDQAGAEHVLVGLFDETTPTLERIKERMRGVRNLPSQDGARFLVVSARPLPGCLGEVETLNEYNLKRWSEQ